MATVEQRHREAAVVAMHPKAHHLTWWVQKWVEEDADADDGMMRRVAQALADAEQRGAESAKAEAQPAGTGWVSVEERDRWRSKFARVVYLGNAARPLDTAERDELNRLLSEGYEALKATR